MKILYGVQGTGNGHISRSREIIKALKKSGHEVYTLFTGRKKELFRDIQDFEPYEIKKGLTFVTDEGRIEYGRTLMQLDFFQFYKNIRQFGLPSYDLVLTDFEPMSARIAMKHRIPSIGIGHQYSFLYDIPVSGWDPFSQLIIRYYAPARFSIGLHWNHFNHPILPPIVPKFPPMSKTTITNKILVYLPFENPDKVTSILSSLKEQEFYIYACTETPEDSGNLHLRPFSRERFLSDLMDCSGVICNAGFELPSEALHLGKKCLVKPLSGQYEQTSNAETLCRLGLGMSMNSLDKGRIKSWLDTPSPAAQKYPDVAGIVAEWISKGNWNDTGDLVQKAWSSN